LGAVIRVFTAVVIALEKSLPLILLSAPNVIVDVVITDPFRDVFAPVVKLAHSQAISQANAPLLNTISTDAAVLNAPTTLKI
jgi:hypothetical protein